MKIITKIILTTTIIMMRINDNVKSNAGVLVIISITGMLRVELIPILGWPTLPWFVDNDQYLHSIKRIEFFVGSTIILARWNQKAVYGRQIQELLFSSNNKTYKFIFWRTLLVDRAQWLERTVLLSENRGCKAIPF